MEIAGSYGKNKNSHNALDAYIKEKSIRNVRIIQRVKNEGKGHSVLEGMWRAKGDLVGYIDFGYDIELSVIKRMLKEFEEDPTLDAVMPNKHAKESNYHASLMRQIFSYGYLFWVIVCTLIIVPDTQTGVKMYRREVVRRVIPRLLIKRFAFEVEMLAAMKQLGLTRWKYVPVKIKMFNDSSMGTKLIDFFIGPNSIWPFVNDTMAVGYRMYFKNWYRKVYTEEDMKILNEFQNT